jgi:iron complex transport system ATP-binding protein
VRALLGRVAIGGGSISVDGTDVARLDRRDLARLVAVVSQREEPVFPVSVRDYIALGRHPHVRLWSTTDPAGEAAIARAVAEAEVAPFVDRTTDELSGGEWQRVRIARALAQDAGALVLDEPTTYLDIAHEMAAFELLDALARRGQAILVVSHQLNLVARFAQRVVLLHRGVVAAAGTPAEVMRGDVLERVYEWPLVVTRDPAVGAPALLPLRGRRKS